jgi:hypothetical protein
MFLYCPAFNRPCRAKVSTNVVRSTSTPSMSTRAPPSRDERRRRQPRAELRTNLCHDRRLRQQLLFGIALMRHRTRMTKPVSERRPVSPTPQGRNIPRVDGFGRQALTPAVANIDGVPAAKEAGEDARVVCRSAARGLATHSRREPPAACTAASISRQRECSLVGHAFDASKPGRQWGRCSRSRRRRRCAATSRSSMTSRRFRTGRWRCTAPR